MSMTKKSRRRLFAVYGGLSVIGLILANAFPGLSEHAEVVPVNAWFIAPFAVLLLSIAVAPFIDKHWWEKNYDSVAYVLGFIVVVYYAIGVHNPGRMLHTAVEYVSFISLIGSLFVVAGGIHIGVRGRATPLENLGLLTLGALLSNVLGTTGASMVLIRPYLRMNRFRFKPFHVVFFIFVVSNIGGALTPIGDPPLFLGYLKGIPFFWITGKATLIWAVCLGLVLAAFFAIDSWSFSRVSKDLRESAETGPDEARISGLHNVLFLAVIIAAVFVDDPAPRLLREVIMWGAAIASYVTTRAEVHEKNEFSFAPVREVAVLFVGIFATMVPALDWLSLNARSIGIVTPGQFYWATGTLSSVLDNAPTYLNFLSASFGLHGANVDESVHMAAMLGIRSLEASGYPNPLAEGMQVIGPTSWVYIQAISLAAVFFGSCTYIGNGPNFMVKSIAEASNLEVPSFFGYVARYAIPILLPIFTLIWFLFYR